MQRLNLTEARKELPNILNRHQTVEVDNRTNSSVIVPKSEWDETQNRLKQMEKELIQIEHDAALARNRKWISGEEVERMLMEKINAKMD